MGEVFPKWETLDSTGVETLTSMYLLVEGDSVNSGLIYGITVILNAVSFRSTEEHPFKKKPEARDWVRGGAGDFRPPLLPRSAIGPPRAVPRHRLGGRAAIHSRLRSRRGRGRRVLPPGNSVEGYPAGAAAL